MLMIVSLEVLFAREFSLMILRDWAEEASELV